MTRLLTKLIHTLEAPSIPFLNYIILFFAAISLRNYFEAFSQQQNHLQLPSSLLRVELIHYTLSYIAIAFAIILIYKIIAREKLEKIARVVLPGFFLLLITPVLDFIVTQGHGINIEYIQTMHRINLWRSYFTYVGDFPGITLGIKCEVLIVLIVSYFYCRIKNANVVKSLLAAWLIYTVLFFFACLPIVSRATLESFGFIYNFSNELMIHTYLIINFVLGMLLVAFIKKDSTRWRSLLFLGLLFSLSLLFGVLTKFSQLPDNFFMQLHLYDATLINFLLACIVIFFATNFLITHHLIQQNVTMILAACYATMINAQAFLCTSVLLACFYIFKTPPLMLRQYKGFNILLLLISISASFMMGYYLVT